MKMTIAELKRRLPVGAEFTAQFLRGPITIRGNLGDTVLPADNTPRRRRVVKQTSQMVSVHLDGPKAGQEAYLTWKGTTARQDTDGSIILTNTEVNRSHWTPPGLADSRLPPGGGF